MSDNQNIRSTTKELIQENFASDKDIHEKVKYAAVEVLKLFEGLSANKVEAVIRVMRDELTSNSVVTVKGI